jgi:uncharacterized protein YbjT (DUF2867 family)
VIGPVLVIGAAGRTGRRVVTRLAEAGVAVVAGVRDPATAPAFPKAVRVTALDVLDAAAVDAAVAGCAAVVFAAGSGGVRPVEVYSRGGANVLEAARRHGAAPLVAITSASAGQGHPEEGAMTEVVADMDRLEALLADGGVPYTTLRPARLLDDVVGEPVWSDADRFVRGSVTGRDDLAAAVVAALGPDGPRGPWWIVTREPA